MSEQKKPTKKEDVETMHAQFVALEKSEHNAEDDGLIAVEKDGVTIRVHPSCLAAHLEKGWTA